MKSLRQILFVIVYAACAKASAQSQISEANGNVGIGVVNPQYKLHISNPGTSEGLMIEGTQGFGAGLFLNNTNVATGSKTYSLYSSFDGNFILGDETASKVKMAIWKNGNMTFNGNVGFGTGNPLTDLHIQKDAISVAATIESLQNGYAALELKSDNRLWQWSKRSTTDGGSLKLFYKDGTWHDFLTMTPNGFLGIGTGSPTEKFQIGDRVTLTDGGWKGFCSNIKWDNNLLKNVRILDGPISGMYYTEKGNTAFLNGATNTAGTTTDDGKYTMILYNSGQVGVGTSFDLAGFSDQTTKLYVEGGMRARKVKVDQATWADSVFHSSYKLRPLNEVENYIKQNNHLPEVPSEAQVKENGIDVGEMNKVLLQKIEELTLYIIEQNKRMEDQQKRIEALEAKR